MHTPCTEHARTAFAACSYCEEPITRDEVIGYRVVILAAGEIAHIECVMRNVVGSVGHQLGRCPCYGGVEEDPPGLTLRQGAREAYDLWRKQNATKN